MRFGHAVLPDLMFMCVLVTGMRFGHAVLPDLMFMCVLVTGMRFGHAVLPDLNDSAQMAHGDVTSSMNSVEEANHVYVTTLFVYFPPLRLSPHLCMSVFISSGTVCFPS